MIVMDISVARKYIEMLYSDKCDIYEYQTVVNPDDCSTETKEVLVHENVPCKMSMRTTSATEDGVSEHQYQFVKILINPDIDVKSGSKVVVTRGGKPVNYKNSGSPSKFFNHQEIGLVLEEDDA